MTTPNLVKLDSQVKVISLVYLVMFDVILISPVRSRIKVSIHSVRSRSIFQGIGLISLSYRSNTPNQSYGNDSGKLV